MHQKRPFLTRKGDTGFSRGSTCARKGDVGFKPTQTRTSKGDMGFRQPSRLVDRAWPRGPAGVRGAVPKGLVGLAAAPVGGGGAWPGFEIDHSEPQARVWRSRGRAAAHGRTKQPSPVNAYKNAHPEPGGRI